jgi:3-hydroxy-5-methyl-1-naphthoate 3-O-methyltransferase
MHPLTAAPLTDPTALYRYRDALYAEDLLIVGLVHLDFFTRLAAEPVGMDGICQRHGLKSRPAGVMITLFRAMGLIEGTADRWEVTPVAREHLVRGSAWFIGPYYASLAERPVAADLLRVLQTDRPANWGSQSGQVDWHRAMERPGFAQSFTEAMDCRGVFLAQALAKGMPWNRFHRLLDVAGGSGIYACSFCAHAPGLVATVLEKPPVDRIASDAIRARGFSDRVAVVAGDMFTDAWPAGHDLHLFSNVLHDWDVPDVRQLLERSHAALPPGGAVLVHDAFLDRELSGPLHVAEYSVMLMHATQGRCYGVGEMEALLGAVGFGRFEEIPGGAARGGLLAWKL